MKTTWKLEKHIFKLFLLNLIIQKKNPKPNLTPRDRTYELSLFVFETPFTPSGKAHGETAEQYKRKTILTTEKPFPFVLKRLRVIDKQDITLTPIENSIEVLEKRCQSFRTELEAIPPNPKTLQIVLQGSVLLQVNAGPLEICRVFLTNTEKYPEQHVSRLNRVLLNFVGLCYQGVQLNKKLIQADQFAFQEQLREGFENFVRVLELENLMSFPPHLLALWMGTKPPPEK